MFSRPLLGAIDIVTVSQLVAIGFAVVGTLIAERHVRVEFIVSRLPERLRSVVDSIVAIFCTGLFVLIIWRLIVLGYSFQTSREATATIYIPLYFFAYGIAVALVPVCVVYLLNLVKAIYTVARK